MDATHQNSQGPDQGNAQSREEASSASVQPIPLVRSVLSASRHVCAFFHSHEEEYRVLLPFIQEGFAHGEKAFHIVDPARRDAHLQRLAAAGIDTATAQQRGQLEVRTWAEAHLRDGYFDQDRTGALIEEVVTGARQQGFPRTRFVTHMEWALEAGVGVATLLEYEAKANYGRRRDDDPVICTYDLARFGGGIVVDIMRTHPMLIIGGILHENPFFVPTEEFLQELRTRPVADETLR
jgi:MEDS: MEthanogen/methylotroph, DcmR Sensory domain